MRTPEGLLIRPLFYDAISGEFRPPSDPSHTHTLGRLVTAAYMKGEFISQNDYVEFKYRPSWASNVTVSIDGDPVHEGSLILHGIDMRTLDNYSLFIADETNEETSGLHIGTWDNDVRYSLGLGADLTNARLAVTQAVEKFFTHSL